MAGKSSLFKFGSRFQPADIQAAAGWGVAAATTALWVVQLVCKAAKLFEFPNIQTPFDWIKKTFFEKPQEA